MAFLCSSLLPITLQASQKGSWVGIMTEPWTNSCNNITKQDLSASVILPQHAEPGYVSGVCRVGMPTASCSAALRQASRGSACPAWWSSYARCSPTGRWSTASPSPMTAGTTRLAALMVLPVVTQPSFTYNSLPLEFCWRLFCTSTSITL